LANSSLFKRALRPNFSHHQKLTPQQKAKIEMRTKATGLCAKSQRIVRMPELKMLGNVLKPKEMATVHARKHFSRGLGRNWIKQG